MDKMSILAIAVAGLLYSLAPRRNSKPRIDEIPNKPPQRPRAQKPIDTTQVHKSARSNIKQVHVELKHGGQANFRREKITEADLPLFKKLEFRDWSNNEFDTSQLLHLLTWVVNPQKSIILKALGGGCFEIPEMYDFVYSGTKIRLHCGGGDALAKTFTEMQDKSIKITLHVTAIKIPTNLWEDQDIILRLAAEALAVHEFSSNAEVALTVEFTLK